MFPGTIPLLGIILLKTWLNYTAMRKAVFITGFNNWGKSTIIFDVFNRRCFLHHWWYEINGINARFTVESHSNDDLWGNGSRDLIQLRVNNETEAGLHLFAALCPTLHDTNDFRQLLGSPPFDRYDELHVLLIEYKYELHLRLMIDNITSKCKRYLASSIFLGTDQFIK